ncbi:MAG: hypothetical protein E7409_04460 [Ruminococcaceae bacterium]|nr:hypothetical protein [Oscillospiraceae bacterium]
MKKRLISLLLATLLAVSGLSAFAETAVIRESGGDFNPATGKEGTVSSGNTTAIGFSEETANRVVWTSDYAWETSKKFTDGGGASVQIIAYNTGRQWNRLNLAAPGKAEAAINLKVADPTLDEYTEITLRDVRSDSSNSGVRVAVNADEDTFLEFALAANGVSDTFGTYAEAPYVTKSIDGVRTQIFADAEAWTGKSGASNINWKPHTWIIRILGDSVTFTIKLSSGSQNDDNVYTESFSFVDKDVSRIIKESAYPLSLFVNKTARAQFHWATYKTGPAYTSAIAEPANVMYATLTPEAVEGQTGVYDLGGSHAIRRTVSTAGAETVIGLSEDGETFTNYTVANGEALNTTDGKKYSYVKFPEGVSADDITLLTDASYENQMEIAQLNTLNLKARLNGAIASDATWSSSAPSVATVENGVVKGLMGGNVTITAKNAAGIMVSTKIRVVDELTAAVEGDYVAEFLASKAPIMANLNTLIANDDTAGLRAFLLEDGETNLSAFPSIDRSAVETFADEDAEGFTRYLDKLATYEPFTLTSLEDMEAFQSELVDIIKLCGLDNIADADDLEQAIAVDNDYFEIDLENEYYLAEREGVLGALTNSVFDNKKDLQTRFVEQYVMRNIANAESYSYVGEVLSNNAELIGYDTDKVNGLKSVTKLYQAIFADKADIADMEALCDYIDDYRETTPTKKPSYSSGGGGGGGSGFSSTIVLDPVVPVEPETPSETEEYPIPMVEKNHLFPDVPMDHWAYEPVRYLTGIGAVSTESEDGTFRQGDPVTRAEFVKMLLLGMKMENEESIAALAAADGAPSFDDVAGAEWYYNYVTAAASLGIVSGGGDGTFRPDAPISREEMCLMLTRTLDKLGLAAAYIDNPPDFADRDTISEWAFPSVIKLSLMGIVNGDTDAQFRPQDTATRAEVAKVIYKSFYMIPVEATAEVANE